MDALEREACNASFDFFRQFTPEQLQVLIDLVDEKISEEEANKALSQ